MQHQARELGLPGRVAVHAVAQHGVADRIQVRPDLVAAPGHDGNLQQGGPAELLHYEIFGDRTFTVEGHGHAPRTALFKRLVDLAALFLDGAFHRHEVSFLDVPRLEEAGIVAVRLRRAGEDDQAAGVAVQAVRDEDLAVTLVQQAQQVFLAGQVPAPGHGQQAGRLVHHQQFGRLPDYL